MERSFPALWKRQQKGFIAIPIFIIAILGTVVVSGGGYAVYKVNVIERESLSRVSDLERKFEEVNRISSTTETIENLPEESSSSETSQLVGSEIVTQKPVIQSSEVVNSPTVGIQQENFNVIAEFYWNSQSQKSKLMIDYINEVLEYIKSDINIWTNVKNQTIANVKGDTIAENFAKDFITVYEADIARRQASYDMLMIQRDFLHKVIDEVAPSFVAEAKSQFFTREMASNYSTKMAPSAKIIMDSFTKAEEDWQDYLRYRDWMTTTYASKISIDSAKSVSQPLPQVKLPTITNTHCTINHGFVSCDSINY